MKFQDLGLSAPLLRAIEEKGYETPTPIQEQAIPPVLRGRDLQGCAQTGTGKTAAFTLPILQLLAEEPPVRGRREIRALVLTPTRELAIQIDECCRDYARYTPIRHCVIFGGVNQRPQVEALQQGVDLLVATPGRLLDLIGQGYITLKHLRFFVLDEADRMLDMGFIHDIRRILPLLPERRQTLFFSATMPADIAALAARILHDPELVAVTPPASVVETIAQRVHFAEKSEKSALLIDLLRQSEARQVLVFTRTKHGADKLARILNKAGIEAAAIHGNKSQNARVRAMNDFKSGACRVLIATDIAARGIDIDQLPLVINYELPEVAETYVHRIGRTGRAGRDGSAWSFCSEAELEYLLDIQRLTGLTIPVEGEVPEYAARALAEAERKQAAKAGRRSAPQPATKKAPSPKKETIDGNRNGGNGKSGKSRNDRRDDTHAARPAVTAEKSPKVETVEKSGIVETPTAPKPSKSSSSSELSKPSTAPKPSKTPTPPEPSKTSTPPELSKPSPSPENPETAPKKRRRRRKKSVPAAESDGMTPAATTVLEKAPAPAARQQTATPAAKNTVKPTPRQKTAVPAAENTAKPAPRQQTAVPAAGKTPEGSARPEKSRTRNNARPKERDNEPKTGIERARSRQVPDHENEQMETQKRIPHTNDWKNRVKSLLLRSFRK